MVPQWKSLAKTRSRLVESIQAQAAIRRNAGRTRSGTHLAVNRFWRRPPRTRFAIVAPTREHIFLPGPNASK